MCTPKIKPDNSAAIARSEEAARQADIRRGATSINETFDGTFNPDYYEQIVTNTIDANLPGLERQYGTANRKLQAGLASRGILESSAGARQLADLLRANEDARTNIANQAQNAANSFRSNVEQTRQNLLSQNLVAADPSQAASTSLAAAGALKPVEPTIGLGDVFSNILNTAGNAFVYNAMRPSSTPSSSLTFGPPKGSVDVVSGG